MSALPRPGARALVAKLAALALVAGLLALSAPPWPDDWDGLGFVAAATRFDMARFEPHPPGYPVYVAALRVAHVVLREPLAAAYGVAIAGALLTASFAFAAARRAFGTSAAWAVAFAVTATPLAWRASSAVGSEALALAFAAMAAWALVVRRQGDARAAVVLGVAVGLGLGVRLSWAPLYLGMLAVTLVDARREGRVRGAGSGVVALLAAAGLAVTAWAVPLLAVVGPAQLVALYQVHAGGHASRWGGTALTDQGSSRLVDLARDLLVDGLGAGADLIGVAVFVGLACLSVVGLRAWRAAGFRHARAAALVLAPYLAWIALGQNLRQQPRHALPLVVAAAAALAVSAAHSTTTRTPTPSTTPSRRSFARWLGAALALLVVWRTASDALARRQVAPPGAQLVAFAESLAAAAPEPGGRGSGIVVFGGPSTRFFDLGPPAAERAGAPAKRAAVAATLDDVRLGLTRLDVFPRRVLVTGEVQGAAEAHLPMLATFCRPPRLDRRAPCLSLYELAVPRATP